MVPGKAAGGWLRVLQGFLLGPGSLALPTSPGWCSSRCFPCSWQGSRSGCVCWRSSTKPGGKRSPWCTPCCSLPASSTPGSGCGDDCVPWAPRPTLGESRERILAHVLWMVKLCVSSELDLNCNRKAGPGHSSWRWMRGSGGVGQGAWSSVYRPRAGLCLVYGSNYVVCFMGSVVM